MDPPRSFLELPWTLEAFSELARAFQSYPELPGLPKSFPGLAAATRSSRGASWSSLIRPGTFQGVLIRQDAPWGYAGAQERGGAIPTPSRSPVHAGLRACASAGRGRDVYAVRARALLGRFGPPAGRCARRPLSASGRRLLSYLPARGCPARLRGASSPEARGQAYSVCTADTLRAVRARSLHARSRMPPLDRPHPAQYRFSPQAPRALSERCL